MKKVALLKRIGTTFTTLLVLVAIVSPFPFILAMPEYAFATNHEATGGAPSWSQAAASGAVSIGTCLAASGITQAISSGLFDWTSRLSIGNLFGSIGSIFGGGSTGSIGFGGPEPPPGTFQIPGAPQIPGIQQGVPGLVVPVEEKVVQARLQTVIQNQQQQITLANRGNMFKMGLLRKEELWDCLAWALAKMIWRKIAADIVDWINSGFNGRPAFLQNFTRFMIGIADQTAGELIQGVGLGFLCSPFQLSIRIALAQRYAQRAPACTLTQVIANVENFVNDFRQGGWPSWLQITTQPNNNPYGGLLIAEATIQLRTAEATLQQKEYLSYGRGFLPKTKQVCRQASVSVVRGQAPQTTVTCIEQVQTPGDVIAKQIGDVVGSTQAQYMLADEFNEIIDALMSQLLMQALNGLFGVSEPKSYGDDYYRFSSLADELRAESYTPTFDDSGGDSGGVAENSLLEQINFSIDAEVALQARIQEAISLIEASQANLQIVQQCWFAKASPTSTPPLDVSDRPQAAIQANNVGFTNRALEQRRQRYIVAYQASQRNVTRLQNFAARSSLITTQTDLDILFREYESERTRGNFADSGDITLAEAEIYNLAVELSSQDQLTQGEYQRCYYYPNEAPGAFQLPPDVSSVVDQSQ